MTSFKTKVHQHTQRQTETHRGERKGTGANKGTEANRNTMANRNIMTYRNTQKQAHTHRGKQNHTKVSTNFTDLRGKSTSADVFCLPNGSRAVRSCCTSRCMENTNTGCHECQSSVSPPLTAAAVVLALAVA